MTDYVNTVAHSDNIHMPVTNNYFELLLAWSHFYRLPLTLSKYMMIPLYLLSSFIFPSTQRNGYAMCTSVYWLQVCSLQAIKDHSAVGNAQVMAWSSLRYNNIRTPSPKNSQLVQIHWIGELEVYFSDCTV